MVHNRNITVICTVFLILSRIIQITCNNGAYLHNFNVLLNLYKMNPLKDSNVYKTFSKQTLSRVMEGNHSERMKLESNEKEIEKTSRNLNQIEQIIHSNKSEPKKQVENPDYEVNNVDTEKFNLEILKVPNNIIPPIENLNFNAIFGHLGSDEIDQFSTTEYTSNTNSTGSPILNVTEPLSTTSSFPTNKSLDSIEFDKLTEGTKKHKGIFKDETFLNGDINELSDVIVI